MRVECASIGRGKSRLIKAAGKHGQAVDYPIACKSCTPLCPRLLLLQDSTQLLLHARILPHMIYWRPSESQLHGKVRVHARDWLSQRDDDAHPWVFFVEVLDREGRHHNVVRHLQPSDGSGIAYVIELREVVRE